MSLVAHYKFRDNAATEIITDSAGTNTGTLVDGASNLTSAHQAVGPLDKAFEFDGADDRFTVVADASINISDNTEYSVVVWVRLKPNGLTYHGMLAKGSHIFFINSNGQIYSEIAHATTVASAKTTIGDVSIGEDKWVMVVMTYNEDADKKIKHYIDGELIANSDTDQAGVDAITDDSGSSLIVGCNAVATSHFIEGKVADYRIYDHALTAHEVLVLYEQFAIWEYDYEN